MQYEIEKAGFTTITLSNVPDFTASTSVPRIAAIEHPFGQVVGKPGDETGHLNVLRAVFKALVKIDTPGEIIHLPFRWVDTNQKTIPDVPPPPISGYLKKNFRQILKFIRREIPPEFQV